MLSAKAARVKPYTPINADRVSSRVFHCCPPDLLPERAAAHPRRCKYHHRRSGRRHADKIQMCIRDSIAAVHEFGATIHPRNAKNLAIPLRPDMKGKSPRDVEGAFFLDNGENRFICRKKGKKGDQLDFLFRETCGG